MSSGGCGGAPVQQMVAAPVEQVMSTATASAPIEIAAPVQLALAASTSQPATSAALLSAGPKANMVGRIVSADDSSLTMDTKDRGRVTMQIRPEDRSKVDPPHMQRHSQPGKPLISMGTETIDGVVYAVGPYKHAS